MPEGGVAQAGLDQLRELLLSPEQQRLDLIQHRVVDIDLRTQDIAEALPEAVRRSARDPALAASLSPLVELGLAQSIRRDPAVVVEVIFPVLGPAIRRAVASAFRGAVESLNRIIEHSFTWRGLRWRVEAWRTGRPIAEVALSRSVVYRVEQVFLIHRETGLPLLVVGVDEARHDRELVSGMLTAIQDFVHDSFSVDRDQDLDRLEVGDFQVWIERGPRAVVAAVIRGSAPLSLREQVAEAVDEVHGQLRERLEKFDGDTTPFEPARPFLEGCLQQEFLRPRKGMQPSTIAALALLGALLAGFFWLRWRESDRWQAYLGALDAEPGLAAVDQGRRDGRRSALVLRDPLAVDPESLLAAREIDPADVDLRIRPVVSSDPEIVARRARALLGAPDSVEIELRDGVLRLSGEAPASWIRRANQMGVFVPGVDSVWLDGLADADRRELDRRVAEIESIRILFAVASSRLEPAQQPVFDDLAAKLKALLERAEAAGYQPSIRLVGGADESGEEQTNQRLRRLRAERIRALLADQGLPAARLTAEPARDALGSTPQERRGVAVAIDLGEPSPGVAAP
ncbi:MAG: OmpA family protein [Acidobacteria bacterium]|nr:OmpA family protein [Acidobacteriota bacterium]